MPAQDSIAAGPLNGTRIVELGAVGPVPFCGMLFADMGAEILRIGAPVEPPGPPIPRDKDPMARGRSHLVLDLKNDTDRGRLLAILSRTEILVEGFRPGTLEKLGIAPEICLKANPALVIGRMTGWGQDGPLASAPGHDPNYIAITGALYAIGHPDRPPYPPLNMIGDYGGGALYLAMGLLAALLHARKTGEGQVIDAAMVDGAASLMGMAYALHANGLWRDRRGANLLDGGAPFGSTYETADGKYVVVAAVEPKFYRALIEGLGLSGEDLPHQMDQAGWPRLRARLAEVFRTRTRDDWARLLEGSDACVSPVLDLSEAPHHPHIRARRVFAGDTPFPRAAPRFSKTVTRHAPQDGGPAAALLQRWGVGTPGDTR
ncbi:MAG: CoA transferase [Alphaproteobacteria bacterium]|nr:CoA transferase [Alphaproteobacteria bacterium]MDE2074440.1 CoA transferase [Alphaproteobacteria bacterium]MDE2350905.1 CoA transferase [Alphaproteobacteria bacterium]